MGVVKDVEQGAAPSDMKDIEKSNIQMPTFSLSPRRALSPSRKGTGEEARALSPNRKDASDASEASEQSEPSIASSSSAPELPVPRQFNVPILVRVGGVALGLAAGNVNCVAFLGIGSFVSHQTGSFARVGMGDMEALMLVTSFVFGSLICGFLVSQKVIPVRVALYDICLIIEAALLVAATFLADHSVARYIVAAACGLQNGFATHWGGAAVRTTHVTGLFTDVGLLIGRLVTMFAKWCRSCGKLSASDRATTADDCSKLSLLGAIAGAFLLGIYLGTHTYNAFGTDAFLIPGVPVGAVGCLYLCYRAMGQCFSSNKDTEIKDVEAGKVEEIKDIEAGKVGGADKQGDAINVVPGSEPQKTADDQAAEKTIAV